MLPQSFPVFPPGVAPAESLLKFSHRYQPTGTVGGDFFNVFPISDSKAGVFICDVMGHGVRSALVTAMIRALVEELRTDTSDPGRLLTAINRDIRSILKNTGSPLFTTAFCLVADLQRRTYSFSNAGHPKPFLVNRTARTAERIKETDGKRRPAMGLLADTEYPTFELPMTQGDSLMLFTDGVFEVEGPGEMLYSQEMLLELVRQHSARTCPEIFDTILRELKGFMALDVFADDICLVGIDVAEKLP
jgi:sigma-B regulation protein RsbU (phosphoserine phosphatase)